MDLYSIYFGLNLRMFAPAEGLGIYYYMATWSFKVRLRVHFEEYIGRAGF